MRATAYAAPSEMHGMAHPSRTVSGEGVHTSAERGLAQCQQRANQSPPVQRVSGYQQLLNTSPRVAALQRGPPRAPVVQRMRITSGDITESVDEAWKTVEEFLWDKGIPDRYWPEMKQQLAAMGEDQEFEYYEDAADLLTQQLNAREGTDYPVGPQEDLDDKDTQQDSGGWGGLAWKVLKYGTMFLAAQSAVENILPKANAMSLPMGPSGPSNALTNMTGLRQDVCKVPGLMDSFLPMPLPTCDMADAPVAPKTWSNHGVWKDWLNAFATGRWSYPEDPTEIPGVSFLSGPNDLAQDGYYAYSHRAKDGRVAISYTGTDATTNNAVPHSYLASGGDVYAAGMLLAKGGQVTQADSASGHYLPDPKVYLDESCQSQVTPKESLEFLQSKLEADGLAAPGMNLLPFRHPNLIQQTIDCQQNRQPLFNPHGFR
ncbi:hypothetical protein FJV41_11930 [Myxococcus llanfairpwllgwyngyllgogerychwyrndrobwllllantysiliogogogochensis]|uniref:Uncharacterized protein n=1 Tax=Myxococcus llanfairpwllgwyngyllgogerychwyrndrobwllllantysiliogogogochensis TaxID=2590453 RepID=A0A540X3F7_9BACT|nr:hypothetical protein [Myxococcus llanfairpwllgwyngyllgogerychwyrndrobwllllantysiliogogogochensis]TQF15779.1 hypothetical protein FJV41_11930 [Myxococcus llanfairpwllgwyngyllgogerychwyrndrobwllllantysiliogogogochensis]